MDREKMKGTLEALFHLWGKNKTVHVKTVVLDEKPKHAWWFSWNPPGTNTNQEEEEQKGKWIIDSYDGKAHSSQTIEEITFSTPF